MKFSVNLPTCMEGLVLPVPFARPEDFVRLGQACERWGYDSAWGNDHITTQRYVRGRHKDPPNFYECFMTLATVGAHTTHLRLGTSLIVLPMRDPVLLAKQAATLDQVTGGRFILGVGLGAYREEFEAWAPRQKRARRGEMVDEGMKALELLFTQRMASFEGKYYAFREVEMFPKPAQQPFPIYVGGHNLEMVERAARYGRGWLPGWRPIEEIRERAAGLKARAAELGRDPREIEIAPQFSVTVGKTSEEAKARYMRSGLVAHRRSLAYTGRDLSRQVEANLVGSLDLIVEKVGRLRDAGVDHCCALMFPVDSVQEMLDQMHWFAESVMPHFRNDARLS